MHALFRRPLTLLLALFLLLPAFLPARAAGFTDVPADAWYASSVRWAVSHGVAEGTAEDRFSPNRPCTRAEAVSFLWRLEGKPPASGPVFFRDVDPSDPWAEAVSWAVGEGLISGFAGGRFQPFAVCSRSDVIFLLWRQAGSPKPEGSMPFSDVPAGRYNYSAILWARTSGVTAGVSENRFAPDSPCTRAQLVCFLHRLAGRSKEKQRLVVIDPGHQLHANPDQEPIGPGSSQTKAKVSGGTYGSASGLHEYELDLTVSLLLRDELERRGYQVLLTRETHDVDLSNAERARIANNAHADVMIRIHANGSTNASLQGAKTINMTKNSPYNAWLYADSRALSEAVLGCYCAATGAKQQPVWDTDTMTGINWSTVPVTILEMGYMSNAAEDLRMADPAYQAKIVRGIADGLDAYFEKHGT